MPTGISPSSAQPQDHGRRHCLKSAGKLSCLKARPVFHNCSSTTLTDCFAHAKLPQAGCPVLGVFLSSSREGVFLSSGMKGVFLSSGKEGAFLSSGREGVFLSSGREGVFLSSGREGEFPRLQGESPILRACRIIKGGVRRSANHSEPGL